MSGKAKKILVIGGAGFIGSHLCEHLLGHGHRVMCVDNLVTGSVDNIAHLLPKGKFLFTLADACTHGEIPNELPDYRLDEIYYLASIASPKHYLDKPLQTIWSNTVGLHYALELAQQHGAKLLYTSTSEVYGNPKVMPQKESYTGNVDPVADRSVYDESKRLGETLCSVFQRKGLDAKIVRIFNTYGPRMAVGDGRVIPNFIMQTLRGEDLTLYGDGSQTRSFCYVSDMVNGLIAMMDSKELGPINLGNPWEYCSVATLADTIQSVAERKTGRVYVAFPSQNDPEIRKPDIEIARKKLGWRPGVPLEEGLRRTIEHFKNLDS